MFRSKMKNPYKEWIERERNLGNPANNLDKLRELFTKLPDVNQAKQAKPAPVKLIPLEGVLKNSQGLNNKDLMQKQMKITRNMKESKPVVPVNNRQGNIHHEEKAKTADPKVVQRYKPLNNQIITLDL